MGRGRPRSDLTADTVRALLDYDPETGDLRWRRRRDCRPEWNTRHAGKIAGTTMVNGYRMISIYNVRFLAHRLAWVHATGWWPADQLDHVNMVRSDNRFANLREANNAENNQNRPKERGNQSGYKGVRFHKASGRWHAQITVNGKTHSLRYHKTPEEAAEAYKVACAKYHGKFSRT